MAARRTHYDVLGVDRDASSVEIASAFRDQLAALQSKPGVLPEALEALREAYQTLANPARREEYDESIAPASTRRPARAADESHDEPGPAWISALKYGIPVVLVTIGIWGWKHKSQPPPPAYVSVTRVTQEAQSAPAPSAAPQSRPGARESAGTARDAEQIFAANAPSIVRVHSYDSSGRQIKQGSGVVIGAGRVITNCHVTSGASSVAVASGADSRLASISIADEEFDLCSLEVAGLDAPAATLGTVSSLRTGQRVFAIGAPLGLELTISEGIVSSLREMGPGKVIQTTAPVSPGSSGGGLFDTEGKLAGVITFQSRGGQNLNFAVPVDWIAEMRNRTAPSHYADDTPAPPPKVAARTGDPTLAEMVVGKWYCFGSISGRNGEYEYGADGIVRIIAGDGGIVGARYRVAGRKIQYYAQDGDFALEIDSISADRMVQVIGGGQRLACDRRG
jgi:serine protease Do